MITEDALFTLRDSLQRQSERHGIDNAEDVDNEIQRRVYEYLELRKQICGHTFYPRLALP